MTDPASMTKKFDRWWAENGEQPPEIVALKLWFRAAFMAGAAAEEATIAALREELAEVRFRPLGDNHHNALGCPYCNPDGRLVLGGAAAERAERERLLNLDVGDR